MTRSKFIIIKHQAKKAGLHTDVRFRIPNSKLWASFACRKEVPLKKGVKILAIRTQDHSEKEALFTGEIKSGYGAGTLAEYDSGDCDIEKYSNVHIVVNFRGSKIKGSYHFVNTGVIDKDFKGQKYLLFKSK